MYDPPNLQGLLWEKAEGRHSVHATTVLLSPGVESVLAVSLPSLSWACSNLPGSSPGGSREFEGGDGVGVLGKIHI